MQRGRPRYRGGLAEYRAASPSRAIGGAWLSTGLPHRDRLLGGASPARARALSQYRGSATDIERGLAEHRGASPARARARTRRPRPPPPPSPPRAAAACAPARAASRPVCPPAPCPPAAREHTACCHAQAATLVAATLGPHTQCVCGTHTRRHLSSSRQRPKTSPAAASCDKERGGGGGGRERGRERRERDR